MRNVVRLPERDPTSGPKPDRPADVIDLSRLDLFNMDGLRDIAADYARLPNPRDVEAAITEVIRDYRRILRTRHKDATGSAAEGAVTAVRAALRAEINRLRTRKEPSNGGRK